MHFSSVKARGGAGGVRYFVGFRQGKNKQWSLDRITLTSATNPTEVTNWSCCSVFGKRNNRGVYSGMKKVFFSVIVSN